MYVKIDRNHLKFFCFFFIKEYKKGDQILLPTYFYNFFCILFSKNVPNCRLLKPKRTKDLLFFIHTKLELWTQVSSVPNLRSHLYEWSLRQILLFSSWTIFRHFTWELLMVQSIYMLCDNIMKIKNLRLIIGIFFSK